VKRQARVALFLFLAAAWAGQVSATTWVVGETGALTFIQAAIDLAAPGDLVLVQPGYYYERLVLRDGVSVAADEPGTVIVDAEAGASAVTASRVGSTTSVSGIIFRHGSATSGGGLYGVASSPVFTACTFEANSAVLGGGIYLRDGSRARFVDCSFTGNTASVGGGMYLDFSAIEVASSTISGNSAADGGALVAANAAEATFTYALIYGNTTSQGSTIACNWASPRFTNCTLAQNSGGESTIAWRGSGTRLERSIIAFNGANAFVCMGSNGPWVGCCIIYGNGSDTLCGGDQGTNVFADPLFCNPASGDYKLAANSPALAGTCGTIGAGPLGCPAHSIGTPVEPVSWTRLKVLYRP
jgi:hypothetical protein